VDDILLPEFVETARGWMTSDAFDVVVFGCEERDEQSGKVISVARPDHKLLASDPVLATIVYKINSISGIYTRNAFIRSGGYDLDPFVLYNEDQAMHANLARAGLRFGGDPTVTVVNLRRANSMWTANQRKCVAAQYHVLRKTAAVVKTQTQRGALAQELWGIVGAAAANLDWETADRAVSLATRLGATSPSHATIAFRVLCQISPGLALRVRELAIRLLRPRTRVGYPRYWRTGRLSA
jgi:hypothetical protein